MQSHLTHGNGTRVLIRRRREQDYLQPSGDWSADRNTARHFVSSVAAYWWAHEQKLLGIEVLLAFDDSAYDLVIIRT